MKLKTDKYEVDGTPLEIREFLGTESVVVKQQDKPKYTITQTKHRKERYNAIEKNKKNLGSMYYTRWSRHEKKVLNDNKQLSIKKLVNILPGRTESAVYNQLSKMNLLHKRYYKKKHFQQSTLDNRRKMMTWANTRAKTFRQDGMSRTEALKRAFSEYKK